MSGGAINYALNGDTSIAYTTLGKGDLDLIFVGGFVSHLEILQELEESRAFIERIASFARVICFDKRGMGLSDRGSGAYTVEAVAEDMNVVLDAVGCERAGVFGVSEGGSAACYFAAAYPERTTALALYGAYARMAKTPDNPDGVAVEELREMTARLLDRWGDSPYLSWWAPEWAHNRRIQEWWGRLLRAGASPRNLGELLVMYEQLDVRPLLPAIQAPTLVTWRRDDKLIPAALSRAVAEAIPGANAVELEGDAHLFFAGDQDALLDEVEEFFTGTRRPKEPQRALATVLFTDIVSSTERAAAVGDSAWGRMLTEHDRLARRIVERERGELVKSTGDGLLASFEGPGRAISAARGIRDAVGDLGLEIRSGIHTGECERLGSDLGGIAVHIGARVGSVAGSGEVLVSQTVRDLVVGSGIEFEDRGSRVLKGVPGEWRLFAVAD
jgi:pimeloyl-ACP methyl ester carboxylesterase